MKVYNQEKTQVLTEYDLSLGRLVADKILKEHHDAVEGKTVDQVVGELQAAGKTVKKQDGSYYELIAEYDNGGKKYLTVKAVPAQEAWDEYEDIQVYVPYTAEEIAKIQAQKEYAENKKRLAALAEDIVQYAAGEDVPDIELRKAEFIAVHNAVREYESKEPRSVR